ncbi:MAG: hypothetical protein II923_00325 [Campylobacter sp.]|nr:hypothetical protein [Campylobacter sp.]
MVKVFKFRPKKEPKKSQNEQNSLDKDFQNEQNFENESSVLNSQNSVGIFKFITIFWIVCLVLNLLNLTNELKFQSQISAVLWFLFSFILIISIYKFAFFGANLARFIIVFIAFCGGFFASALYFGSITENAFEFGGVCALLTLFFSFGFAVIV